MLAWPLDPSASGLFVGYSPDDSTEANLSAGLEGQGFWIHRAGSRWQVGLLPET